MKKYLDFMQERNQTDRGVLNKPKSRIVSEAKKLIQMLTLMLTLLKEHAGRFDALDP